MINRFPTKQEMHANESFDVIRERAFQAQLLRDNPAFRWAINAVFHDLVEAEDSITGDAGVEPRVANDSRRDFSGMRVSLIAVVEKLDDVLHDYETHPSNPVNTQEN